MPRVRLQQLCQSLLSRRGRTSIFRVDSHTAVDSLAIPATPLPRYLEALHWLQADSSHCVAIVKRTHLSDGRTGSAPTWHRQGPCP